MSFETVLREILQQSSGIGIALVGSDGIPILQIASETGEGENPLGDDIGTAAVEFARILLEIHKASDALNAGSMSETVIHMTRFQLVFRQVDDDIFLVLALPPAGIAGKARYQIQRNLHALREEL